MWFAKLAAVWLLLAAPRAWGSLVLPQLTEDPITYLRQQTFEGFMDLWSDLGDLRIVAQVKEQGSAPDEHLLFHTYELTTEIDALVEALGIENATSHNARQLYLEPLWLWAQASRHLTTIGGLYKTFVSLLRDRQNVQRQQWVEFANATLNPHGQDSAADTASSLTSALDHLHELSTHEESGGLFRKLRNTLQESDGHTTCSISQSPQQLLYNVYNLVAVSELKGYTMMQFSWQILRQYEKGNFTREVNSMHQQTEQRAMEKAKTARDAMSSVSRFFWQCDPKVHEEGATYVQLTSLLQGHIQNEVDMNPGSTCRERCAYYSYAKVHGCYHNLWCSKQRACNGRLFNCQFIDSDAWICPSKNTNRKYDYIEYENGRHLGKKNQCSRSVSKVDSWWRWIFWHCSYCFCLCDDPGQHSDRYFSLRPVIADVSMDRVITGLRFVKAKRVIHIQIQEGKVLSRGSIESESTRWRPVDSFKLENAAPGVDYHIMTFEQRAMDLDDLMAPEGYVLTGMRFRRIGTHLNPEILVTPLDMESGTLKHDGSFWLGNDNTDASITGPRTQMSLSSPDVPTLTDQHSEPDSKVDQYVLFTNSDINKDVAQTTVPFLDAQPVAPSPPTLLSGAGIYHKGRIGYGGFVALRLITYDFSNHLGLNGTDNRLNELT